MSFGVTRHIDGSSYNWNRSIDLAFIFHRLAHADARESKALADGKCPLKLYQELLESMKKAQGISDDEATRPDTHENRM